MPNYHNKSVKTTQNIFSKKNSQKFAVILGLDPGFADTGFGIIQHTDYNLIHVAHGSIVTHAQDEFSERLRKLHEELKQLIKLHNPRVIAIEKIFFAKNQKTALDVAQARGVLLLTAIQEKRQLREFTPLQVKQAITGYGSADKHQVQQMVKTLLHLESIPKPDDAADALAVAICAAHTTNLQN